MNSEHGKLSPKTARLVCRLAASMVVTDDDFAESERAFIDRVLKRFHIPETEWDAIYPLLDPQEAAAALGTLGTEDQRVAFNTLIEAALIDGVLAAEEREFLLTVGGVIGMDEQALNEQLTRMSQL